MAEAVRLIEASGRRPRAPEWAVPLDGEDQEEG
jgi:hypothetical protein